MRKNQERKSWVWKKIRFRFIPSLVLTAVSRETRRWRTNREQRDETHSEWPQRNVQLSPKMDSTHLIGFIGEKRKKKEFYLKSRETKKVQRKISSNVILNCGNWINQWTNRVSLPRFSLVFLRCLYPRAPNFAEMDKNEIISFWYGHVSGEKCVV